MGLPLGNVQRLLGCGAFRSPAGELHWAAAVWESPPHRVPHVQEAFIRLLSGKHLVAVTVNKGVLFWGPSQLPV